MTIPAEKEKYTYEDYLNWPEDERWELIDGVPYNMTPAPSRAHQSVLGELHRQISNYLFGKECNIYIAPFDVILSEENTHENIYTVVQPDIAVICDKSKLNKNGCKGSPDLVIEIISPSTARKDTIEKFNLYEKNGIREYWIVRPDEKTVTVFQIGENGKYGRPQIFSDEDKIQTGIFNDLAIDLKFVFND